LEHDEEKYPQPNVFQPERFLNEEGKLRDDYSTTAFGFGRRSKLSFTLFVS
jgi:cytochrome P450